MNTATTSKTEIPFFSRVSTHYLILIITGALLFIPLLGNVHLYDWDELNFAEATREMLNTGNFMRVTINYEPFWEKPPLFFWLQAVSMSLFGVNEFAARFVNAMFGIFTLLLVYTIGRRRYDSRFGLIWAFAFAASFLPHVFFKSGIIDPVFNFFIFTGITFAYSVIRRTVRRERLLYAALAGASIGLAMLAKGPVAMLVTLLTLGVFWAFTKFRPLFSIVELLVFGASALFVSGIFYGVETLMNGPWFMTEFVRYQIRLLRTGDAGHGRPFYFHFIILLFGCFPASFFAIRSFKGFKGFTDDQQTYNRLIKMLFWVVLVLFSIVKTKTVLYSSLCWYPITYLGALHGYRLVTGKLKWSRQLMWSFVVFTVLVGIGVTAFPIVLKHKEIILPLIKDKFAVACMSKPVVWTGWESLIGIVFLGGAILSFFLMSRRKNTAGLITIGAASVFCVQMVLIVINPRIEQYTQSDPVAFFKKHSGGDVYVRSLFKSYADLFYSKKMPDAHPKSYEREWLLKGPIDKPAYFVGRIQQDKKYGKEEYNLVTLEKKYGFVYYRRDP